MSVLIICEKPSVAKTVALALGAAEQKDGYLSGDGLLVSWCIGHLISMADAGSYDERYKKWRYEDLPILPQAWKYAPTPGKEKQLAVLKELLHRSDVSEIVNACDSGREGELIFRFVYEQVNCQKPFSRLWISSMEESAIRTPSRNGIRRAVSIGAVPCAGRLACGYQCDAAFLRAVSQDPECGTGAFAYAESAGGARRKNYDVPQGKIPHRTYRLRRRGREK